MTTIECEKCGSHFSFYKPGYACNMLGCDGKVVEVQWVRAKPLESLVEALRTPSVHHPGAYEDGGYVIGYDNGQESAADSLEELLKGD